MYKNPWFEVFQESIRLPNGRLVDDFFTIDSPEYTVMACFDGEGNILAERLYRHGGKTVTWSVPAGYIQPGETAEDAARRELREETGLQAGSLEKLGQFVVDGNRGCGWAHLFVARDLTKVATPDNDDLASTELIWIPYEEMLQHLFEGEVAELSTAATLAMVSARKH